MSYSLDTKNFLCGIKDKYKCCNTALLYGISISAHTFTGEKIRYVTENINIANKIERLFRSVFKTECGFQKYAASASYRLEIEDKKFLRTVLNRFKYKDKYKNMFAINNDVFMCDNCKKAFTRGLFISCGTIAEPVHGYHLELALNNYVLTDNIKAFLEDNITAFKTTERKRNYILYLKGSEKIEDFLYYINAVKVAFDIMEKKIIKEVRNNANRITNFENANIKKISNASAQQIKAINDIMNIGKFEKLPDELKQTAKLRLENIELSMQEIGEMSDPKLTKSGVNHRIKKLMEIAYEGQKNEK